MDHRGHPRPESRHHSPRPKDRDDYYRGPQRDRDQSYPPLNPREMERHWAYPDDCYRPYFNSPPTRLDQYPGNTQQYPYGNPEHHRPQSRHVYDYPPYSHWGYRGNYAYERDYGGQHGRQDGGQWGPQDSWRTHCYPDRAYRPGHSGGSYTDEYSYDQGKENSQRHFNDSEENPSRDNEEVASYYQGTLESSKNSGFSSSSYELSQYINGAEQQPPVLTSDAECGPVHQMDAPLKYSIPHAVVSFGPAGQLIRVTPGMSSQQNSRQLEIHSLEVILSDTREQQEMRTFPGPLTRDDLHKVDAIEFAHQMAEACMRDDKLRDRSSAALLWNLLILLCRQNGQIVGSDIAELLMQGPHSDGRWESEAPTLIDFSEGSTSEAPPVIGDDLLTGSCSSFSSEASEKALQSYTQLLLAGRKKEALESAMSSGLWGHALFLASKMDSRSYTTVLNRFTGQLAASDPLQTVFQLLSGRIPAVATCYGNEKWGDWRPHLAVMLSNEIGDSAVQQKAVVTMGDALASKGLLHAAHVCYLTAGVRFGAFTQKAERLVLLGSSHRQPFESFALNAAIRCTELYEYCRSLGGRCFSIPSFQVYKFLYASRLLDCGLWSQAFHYCEVLGQAILRQREPSFVLTGEVIKLSDRLRHTEGQFGEAGVSGAGKEPDWLRQLRMRYHSLQVGSSDCTETCQPLPEESVVAHEDGEACLELNVDALRCDIQSPETELLYYRGAEDQESLLECPAEEMPAASWDSAPGWPRATSPVPVRLAYTPPVPTLAVSQDLSYHNTDSAEVRSVSPHCPLSDVPTAEGVGSSSGTATSPKDGWFSRWFKSKPKDGHKEAAEPGYPALTELPATAAFCPPPPPPVIPAPAPFPSQPSSVGINPFSRKAGQQLR